MRLADGMSKAAVAFLAKQLAAENTHTGNLTPQIFTKFHTLLHSAVGLIAWHTTTIISA